MEEDIFYTMIPLSEFLELYGIKEEGLTTKEKLEILKQIVTRHQVDKDFADLLYSQKTVSEKTKEVREEYVSTLNNLDVRIMSATGYIMKIKGIEKEERKLKRKEVFQKIFKGLKK